jgi:hypothetical protein
MEPRKAAQNRGDSPPMILIMRGELLDDTKDGYLRAICSDSNSREQLWIEGSQLTNEIFPLLLKFGNGGIAIPGCVRVSFGPQTDIDRLKNRPILREDAAETQTIEICVAIQRVPQMLKKMRLVVLGLTQQRFAWEACEGAMEKDRHFGQLTKQTQVEVLLHGELRFRGLTFDVRGRRKWAKPACGCPLDGGVRAPAVKCYQRTGPPSELALIEPTELRDKLAATHQPMTAATGNARTH